MQLNGSKALLALHSAMAPVQERLKKRIENAKIKILNPPRQGKKVVVLDIDYTIFDLNSTAGPTSLSHALLICCDQTPHEPKLV